jgi:hypothetical protein
MDTLKTTLINCYFFKKNGQNQAWKDISMYLYAHYFMSLFYLTV